MGVSIYRRIRIPVRLVPFGVRLFFAAFIFGIAVRPRTALVYFGLRYVLVPLWECCFDIFWIAGRPGADLDILYSAANRAALDYIPTSPSFTHFYTPPLQQTSPQA